MEGNDAATWAEEEAMRVTKPPLMGQVQMQSAGHFGHCANSVHTSPSLPSPPVSVAFRCQLTYPNLRTPPPLRVPAPRTNRGFTLLAPLLLPLQNTLNRTDKTSSPTQRR